VRGDQQRVVDAFARYLSECAWAVSPEVEFCDLVAEREGERLFVEAKGRTEAIGTDVDTMYGQIPSPMPLAEESGRWVCGRRPGKSGASGAPPRVAQS